jgi:hypothetical protein
VFYEDAPVGCRRIDQKWVRIGLVYKLLAGPIDGACAAAAEEAASICAEDLGKEDGVEVFIESTEFGV